MTAPKKYATDKASLKRDTEVAFLKDSGPGGQHRNKRETGVRLWHRPSGIKAQETRRRSQAQNRALAFERLRKRLEKLNIPPPLRIPTKKPRRAIEERLADKRERSQKKDWRRESPSDDE